MLNLRILFFLMFCSTTVFGQYVQGNLTDDQGEPLPFASIYVKESMYGVSSDSKGHYFLELSPGDYTIVFSFIGYESQEQRIELLKRKPLTLDVTLKETSTNLMEVEIVANTKDRAKEIMKNVRDQRRFYLQQVATFQCNTYLKTSLEKELVKPRKKDTIKATEVKDDRSGDMKSFFKKEKLNLIESFSETYYKEPGKYKEIVTAYHDYAELDAPPDGKGATIGLEWGEDDIAPVQYESDNAYLLYQDISNADFNFYKNLISYPNVSQKLLLSPIAANSALSYTYNLAGSFYEDGVKIYKLTVDPIFKSEALFAGTIYIEDSTWALRTVDLSINKAALLFCKEFRIIQNYAKIDSNQYLPVRRELTYTIKDGRYNILGNTRVDHSEYKVNVDFPQRFFNNEVKRFEVDAYDKDSSFWATNRPLTLKETELEFVAETDSMSRYYSSAEYYRKIDSSFNRIDFWAPLNGIGHRNRLKGTEWYISGLFEQVNPLGIGGYRHKLPGYFNKTFENDMLLETEGFVDYGFKNKDIKGKGGIGLTYVPKKFVRTFLRFGDYYDMINDYASVEQIFSRSNYVRTKMFSVAQRMEIVNGLFGELTFEYSDQQPIDNIELSRWSEILFDTLNTPLGFERYTKSELSLELKYRIKQKYIIKGNKKVIVGSDLPVITFKYRKGIPNLFNSEVNFDYIEIGASDELKLARLGSSQWRVQAGSFVNKKNLRLLEHKYFRGSDRFFFSDPLKSFQLLGPTLSTPNEYLQANYMHHFEGTLLNKVPIISKLKLAIAGGAGTLIIPDEDFAHFEMFAGVERIVRIKKQLFRFSVFAVTSDNSFESPDFTLKFGINFFNTFTNKWDY
jgi:hypothetical protein